MYKSTLKGYVKKERGTCNLLDLKASSGFRFLNKLESSIHEKVFNKVNKTVLSELAYIRAGVETAYDEAFFLTKEEAERLKSKFNNDRGINTIVRQRVQGKDLNKGVITETDNYILYLPKNLSVGGIPFEASIYYHEVLKYLEKYREGLENRAYNTPNWYNIVGGDEVKMANINYVFSELTKLFDVTELGNSAIIPTKTCRCVTTELKCFKDFFNTDLVGAIYNLYYAKSGVGNVKCKNVKALNSFMFPNEFIGVNTVTRDEIIKIYGLTEKEVKYLDSYINSITD